MKTDEHNKFRWLMLLATLSALVASFVMRHLQDAGTMEPLQHGLLVYCCVVVVVLLVVMVKHLPADMKRNAEEERAKRQKMEQLFREAERNERERRKQRDYISDEEIENEIKRICIDNNSDFIPML